MSPRGVYSLPKAARLALLIAFLVCLGIILANVFSRHGEAPADSTGGTLAENRKVDRKEDVRHLEFKAGTAWLDARGDRFYLGDDGLNHFEGNVRIVDRDTGRGAVMTITADTVSFDQDLAGFAFSGNVEIREGDAVLSSRFFAYDKDSGLVRSNQGVTFRFPRLAGTAGGFRHDMERDILALSGGFRLEISPGSAATDDTTITGRDFLYERPGRTGRAGGGISIRRPRFRASSRELEFRLDESEQDLEWLALKVEARCEFGSPEAGGNETEHQNVAADRIVLANRRGSSVIESLEASGSCVLSVTLPSRRPARISGDTVGFKLDASGRVRGLVAQGRSRMELADETGGRESIEAPNISYRPDPGDLAADGFGKVAVVADTPRTRIEADAVRLNLDSDGLFAKGRVKGILRSKKTEPPIGFFIPGETVFYVCQELAREKGPASLTLSGGVRVWQGEEHIEAGEFVIKENSGSVEGRGGVAAGLRQTPSGSPEETFAIRADRMVFDPDENVIRYGGQCEIRGEKFSLSSRDLRIDLGSEGGGIRNIKAGDGVVIRQGPMEARGGEAVYNPESETIVLVGEAVFLEPGRGSVRGDKLTFRLADDRIFIENKGRERSVAVIKSWMMKGFLRAVDLEKSFGSRKVVDKVTVEVGKGEVIGLLGPNGAGKTTTFSIIMGLVPCDGGDVYLGGENISRYPMYVRARRGIGLLPQDPSVFRKLSVEENLMAVLETLPSGGRGGGSRVAKVLEGFGLGHLSRSKAVTLSGGERRRLEIARAMILEPEFLLLDEPFTGVDPLGVQDIQEIIRALKIRGLGVLLTDHSVRETLKITDRAYIMDKGMVIQEGPPERIMDSETVRRSYLGEDFRP